MAVTQPATGTRSSGVARVVATGSPVMLPRSAYAVPRVLGVFRPDLLVKVAAGPDAGDAWEVTSAGDDVAFVSNLGGDAQNQIPTGSELVFDPPIQGLQATALVAAPGFAGGVYETAFGSLKNITMYETFGGPKRSLDMFRSALNTLPAAILTWTDSQQADGAEVSIAMRETRVGTRSVLYKEQFSLWVVSSRNDGDHQRRAEGLAILEHLSVLLTDRQMVDGVAFSSPSGVQIRRRYRDPGDGQGIYQNFYVYVIELAAEHALVQQDSRTFNPWLVSRLDMDPIDNDPVEPIVDNNLIDMTP